MMSCFKCLYLLFSIDLDLEKSYADGNIVRSLPPKAIHLHPHSRLLSHPSNTNSLFQLSEVLT